MKANKPDENAMRAMNRHSKQTNRTAAAAVELAFVLPFLMLVFAAAIDFARVFYVTQTMTTASITGANYASGCAWVATASESRDDAAKNAVLRECKSFDPPVTSDQIAVTRNGQRVTVTVTYRFPLLTAFLVPSGSVDLQRTMTVANAPRPGD